MGQGASTQQLPPPPWRRRVRGPPTSTGYGGSSLSVASSDLAAGAETQARTVVPGRTRRFSLPPSIRHGPIVAPLVEDGSAHATDTLDSALPASPQDASGAERVAPLFGEQDPDFPDLRPPMATLAAARESLLRAIEDEQSPARRPEDRGRWPSASRARRRLSERLSVARGSRQGCEGDALGPSAPSELSDPPSTSGSTSASPSAETGRSETRPVPSDPSRPRMPRLRGAVLPSLPSLMHNIAARASRLSSVNNSNVQSQTSDVPAPVARPPQRSRFPLRTSPQASSTSASGAPTAPTAPTPRPRRTRSSPDVDLRSPSQDGQARRRAGAVRGGASRAVRGEDQAAMLSRLLSVAAAATAASLVGDSDRAFSEAHDVAGDCVDGSFEGFLQALQNGSLAAALRNGGQESAGGGSDAAGTEPGSTPVNFFRMFRFGTTPADRARASGTSTPADDATGQSPVGGGQVPESAAAAASAASSSSSTTSASTASSSASSSAESTRSGRTATPETTGARMVPVIIVGIRSVPPVDGLGSVEGTATPPLFDALSNLPLTLPNAAARGGSGTLMRRTDRGSRLARSRRASMSAVNHDGLRPQRLGPALSRPAAAPRPFSHVTLPSSQSESPPGPHPPPSTPAEYGASVVSSGSSTPNLRPSSATGGPSPANVPTVEEGGTAAASASVSDQTASPNAPNGRRRRLSDGEFARYRDLGPGSSRRHGIVGDHQVNPGGRRGSGGASANEGTRSWIIYVLGGSYPEDHPILTTPSLFTDSPTYEDMLLLASILGPSKPPVATAEDVASAPGVGRLTQSGHLLVAQRAAGGQLEIAGGERCLICLCDYVVDEEVRQLAKCGHVYHRDCIDEWLTTGRNSCPLCRERGVDEKARAADAAVDSSS